MNKLDVCSPVCRAEKFRQDHPNHSFTFIGYATGRDELYREYEKIVDVSSIDNIRGKEEKHFCKVCKKEVYSHSHS